MKRLHPLAVAFVLAVMMAWAAGAQEKVTPEQQIQQLQQALAQRMGQVGACHTELGTYQQQLANGQLVTWAQVRAALQAANPGYTFGEDLKWGPIPEAKTKP